MLHSELERLLLGELLDKYERTSAFRRGEPPKQRIILKLYDEKTGRTHACYNVEDSLQRQAVNGAVLDLAKLGLVDYTWVQWEQGNLMANLWLIYPMRTTAYEVLGRTPKRDQLNGICLELLDAIDRCAEGWGQDFLQRCYQSVVDTGMLGKQLPAEEFQRQALLRCIIFASQPIAEELLERVFSIQCLGNSKSFETHVRGRLLSILRTALSLEDEETDEAVLRQIGIAKYPEQFEFCGDISLITASGATHFGKLQYGTALFRGELEGGTFEFGKGVTEVLTIENRANYIQYIAHHRQAHQVVVYHGGQYSPAKKQFFLQLAKALDGCGQWCHWGDIDWGGFSMLSRLRREVATSVTPYRMGETELRQHTAHCTDFSNDYGMKLKELLRDPWLEDCDSVIEYMLENCCRLEQEALL